MSQKRIVLEPSYLLHARPYRDTSVIADFITPHHGRMAGVIRGVRTAKSKRRPLMQPFCPLVISWTGRGDLVTVTVIEAAGKTCLLRGNRLICGLYVNELIHRLLPPWQNHEQVFGDYINTIASIADLKMSLQPTLRLFEKQLLENLGYGIDLRYEAHTHQRIESDRWYRYQMDEGLLAMNDNHKLSGLFSGKVLLAIASNDFSQPPVCAEAKRLMRLMITPLLGNKALMSRELLSPEGET